MKSKKIIYISAFAILSVSCLAGCGGGGGGGGDAKFDFSISFLNSSNNILYSKVDDYLKINERNAEKGATYTYKISFSGVGFDGEDINDYVSAEFHSDDSGKYFTVSPKQPTATKDGNERYITASVTEASVKNAKTQTFAIINSVTPADAGYNYAADKNQRLEILGILEKYAMENYLTGITLFENGGYVKYSDRVYVHASEYITGYGWGVLTEGKLNGTLPNVTVEPTYYQSAMSSDPLSINAWDATGSQVSDLNGYISTSYWGTRMKGKTEYEWYPVLAKDKITVKENGVDKVIDNLRPVHVEDDNPTNLYKKWRIYVKTGDEKWGGIKYRTNSENKDRKLYNNRPVALEDYEFVFQMLLSERSQLVRGSELAGDTSYGIKGGQAFFRKSKNIQDVVDENTGKRKLDELWKQMTAVDPVTGESELGVHTGTDSVNGPYIELELVNPIDEFTAMYTLSSNLYTPIPKDFIREIGEGDYTIGAVLYGTFPSANADVRDYSLCLGPYFLQRWSVNDNEILFKRNDDWFEYTPGGSRYQIPGVRIRIVTAMTENALATWQLFENGELDSTGIPKEKLSELDLSQERQSGGDSTFKLNVNSCTQEEWNRLFGANGVIRQGKDNEYEVKPWMSNKNFLKGLYWSIDREKFAKDRGVTPSYNYFAGSYMSDPEKGVSYNSTPQHAAAVDNFHNIIPDPDNPGKTKDDYGYDLDTAVEAFAQAVDELLESGDIKLGTEKNPYKIEIDIEWMYQTDIRDYGKDIAQNITDAFNHKDVCGNKVELVINQDAVTQWDKVYTDYLMVGKYDLGFGAISGNSYNPLNFLEVLKSDNSSGFTLNWGTNTGVIDENNPIVFEGKSWSFDALWAAADHGTVVTKGKDENPVTNGYVKDYGKNDLYNGSTIEIPFSFTDVDPTSVEFNIDITKDIQLYLSGAGTIRPGDKDDQGNVYFTVEHRNGSYFIVISKAGGEAINKLLVDANNLEKKADKETDQKERERILHPFTSENYNEWWNIEIHYTISINGGIPSDNTFYVYRSLTDQERDRK